MSQPTSEGHADTAPHDGSATASDGPSATQEPAGLEHDRQGSEHDPQASEHAAVADAEDASVPGDPEPASEDAESSSASDVERDAALDVEIEDLDDGAHATDLPLADIGAQHRPVANAETTLFAIPAREQIMALGDPGVTGEARVDAATARLSELVDLPTSEHGAVYDDIHRRLQDALADADVR